MHADLVFTTRVSHADAKSHSTQSHVRSSTVGSWFSHSLGRIWTDGVGAPVTNVSYLAIRWKSSAGCHLWRHLAKVGWNDRLDPDALLLS
jgi:hypothetical protein